MKALNINHYLLIYMKIIKFLLIALVFFVAGFFLGQSYQLPVKLTVPNEQAGNFQPLTYVLQFSEHEIIEFQNVELNENQTVLDLLRQLAEENQIALITEDYDSLGVLVTAVGDKANGQDNKYWQYWVNGEMPQVGADRFQLTGGERVEWKFTEFVKEDY